MAAKKVVAKKNPSSKSTPSRSDAKASEVEVVEETPDLMTPEVVKQIAKVGSVIGRLDRMTEVKLAENIEGWASLVADFSKQAVQAGASALVYAWACGRLLN